MANNLEKAIATETDPKLIMAARKELELNRRFVAQMRRKEERRQFGKPKTPTHKPRRIDRANVNFRHLDGIINGLRMCCTERASSGPRCRGRWYP